MVLAKTQLQRRDRNKEYRNNGLNIIWQQLYLSCHKWPAMAVYIDFRVNFPGMHSNPITITRFVHTPPTCNTSDHPFSVAVKCNLCADEKFTDHGLLSRSSTKLARCVASFLNPAPVAPVLAFLIDFYPVAKWAL